jgi:hypothetical protein
MRRKIALTHLQTILLIDLIIVASAAGGYFYLQSIPAPLLDPANVQLSDLTLSQTEILIGQSVSFSINVTNISTEEGSYVASLHIDGAVAAEKRLEVTGSETQVVVFDVANMVEGAHVANVGSSEAPFTVLSIFRVSDLAINRTEAKIGEPIGISVTVTNRAATAGDYSIPITINNTIAQTKTGHLEAGASTPALFEVSEQEEGTYAYKVGELNGTFHINPLAPPPRPAEFNITDLAFDPDVGKPGSPVSISVNVTNVGELSGSISLDFTVNGTLAETKTLQLAGGEMEKVTVNVTEALGTYAVEVGNLTGQFSVQAPSLIALKNMYIKPYEVWGGQNITVVATATNPAAETSSLSVKVKISIGTTEVLTQTQTITLAGGATQQVQFVITAPKEISSYKVAMNDLTGGGFKVVKDGFHSLSVSSSPVTGADVTVNGVAHKTFYSELLPEGTYTVSVPATDPTGRFSFQSWDDGVTSPTRTVHLNQQISLGVTFSGGSSCPSLYYWNGTGYIYAGDVSNHGWLGYINYMNSDASITYYRNNPWDYVKLDRNQVTATNGNYNVSLIQKFNEIFYLDQAYMLVVDHPANVDVYSTMVEQYLDPAYMGKLYSVSNSPQTPLSAVNEKGENVLSQISKMDNVFTKGNSGLTSSPSWDNISWNRITLNLGNLAGAKQVKLVVRAIVDWGAPEDYGTWLNQFYNALPYVPNGTQVTPPPYMEVKDAKGNWMRIPDGRQFPLPADSLARTYVIDLTGLFPTNDYSLQISNFWNVTFDYVGIDTTPQQALTIQRIDPHAYLYQEFVSPSNSSGNFTRYGDVTQLVGTEDDMFVIGRQGDAVSLQFSTAGLKPVEPGMVRDYFVYESCWFKDENGNWGFGFGFTSDPLPFRAMSGFPYLPSESYPSDPAHMAYITTYNTRMVPPKITP